MLGLPLKTVVILSIIFHGLIIVFLIGILVRIIADGWSKDAKQRLVFSGRTFRIGGLFSLAIVGIGGVFNAYVETSYDMSLYVSQFTQANVRGDLAYMSLITKGQTILRTVIFISIYFVIVLRHRPI